MSRSPTRFIWGVSLGPYLSLLPHNALTSPWLVPKMAVWICGLHSHTMRSDRRRELFFAIATDIHFWIPLGVLLAGLVLLDKLR